jgi:hypothetical protein
MESMNYKFYLLTLICVFSLASCSKFGKSESDVVIIDDKPKTNTKNEVVIDDAFFDSEQEAVSASKTGSHEMTKITFDKSRIDTMYDQFGNKTETRCFNNHLRLKCITISSAADGKKKISVYGQNGEIKGLPEAMIGKALTAPADELANSAGIYQIYRQPAPVTQSVQSRTNLSLQPMPSYNFPVQNRPVEQVAADEAKPVPADQKPSEKKDDSSTPQPDKEQ